MKVAKAPGWGSGIAGAGAALIGGSWLVAWWAGYAAGWSAAGTMVTVKTNMALGLLLAGVGLMLLGGDAERPGGLRRWAGAALAILVLLLGSLTLSEHLLGYDLGIDQLLATEAPGALWTISPNRMGPPGALCQVLLGIALLTLALGRRRPAPYLGLTVCIVNLIPAVGYLYGIHEFYGRPMLIAWPTMVALVLLGGGLVLTRPDFRPRALWRRRDGEGTWGSLAWRYSMAAVTVGIAALLRWGLVQAVGELPAFITFYPAVLLVALVAGRGPGILAIALAVLVGNYWFLPPFGQFHIAQSNDLATVGIFSITTLLLCVLAERLRQARAVEAAAEQKELLAVTLASIGDGVIVTDPQGRVRFLNGEAQRLTGWTLAEAQGRPLPAVFQIINEDTRQSIESPADKVMRLGTVVGLANHTLLVAKDGRETPIDDSGAPIRNAAGEVQGVVLVFRDFSEQKAAEAALRESESFFRQTLESIPGMVFTTRPDGYCDYQSQQWVEFTGVPMSEHVGDGWNKLLHPDDRPRAFAAWRDAVEGRAPYDVEYRVRRSDGQYEWFMVRGRPIHDAAGHIVRWFGVATSIEAMRRAEEALRASEQRVRQKLEALLSPAGDIGQLELADIIDVPAIQSLMDRCYALMGIPMAIIDLKGEVLVGVGWQDICTQYHRKHPGTCQYCIESDTLLTAGVAPGEFRLYKCKNHMWDVASPILVGGKHVGNLFTGQFFFDDEPLDRELFRAQAAKYGFDEAKYMAALELVPRLSRAKMREGMAYYMELAGMLSLLSYSNISLARSTEELTAAKHSAEQASKAKDHFLAVLSHELRTPLAPVLPALAALETLVAPEGREFLEISRRNVELEARLIDDLLDVTRITRGKISLDRRPVQLCTVIGHAAEVCQPDIAARRLHFGVKVENGPHIVNADIARLQQVFWNLIKNAVKFTPQDGCVGVYCHRTDGRVLVEVSDSGEGIEAEALERIFNAFEQEGGTTSRRFGGLGLGLAISKALVELHGGKIEARSPGRGKGATFTVELPLHEPEPTAEPRPGIPAGPQGTPRGLSILLVEDHGDTARVLGRLLTADGHTVKHAGAVATALEMVMREDFDLLLSDLGLPDGSGHDLMRQLVAAGKRLPAIALSGYGMAADVQNSRAAGFLDHITKPVQFEILKQAISRAMESSATSPAPIE